MGKSQRLGAGELRAVYRLLSDLREMRHDRPAMHQHLADTICELIGATGGFGADIVGWRPDSAIANSQSKLGVRSFTPTRQGFEIVGRTLRELATNNNLWDDPTFAVGIRYQTSVESLPFHRMMDNKTLNSEFPVFAQVKHESKHVDHLLGWFQKRTYSDGTSTGDVFGVSMHRYGQGGKLFAGREEALVKLLFEELHHLHTTGRLTSVNDTTHDLPPRLKQVLDLLLDGHAPKQIGLRLGLSTHTVREHIARLYKQTGVNGRDELMARFTLKNKRPPEGWDNDHA